MNSQTNARPWTAAEIAYLRENYATMRTKLIALHLGRTGNSVIGKADRLGLAAVPADEWQRRIHLGHAEGRNQ